MSHFFDHAMAQAGRRTFLFGTAGTVAARLTASLGQPGISEAAFSGRPH
jgi:hypothetical protein